MGRRFAGRGSAAGRRARANATTLAATHPDPGVDAAEPRGGWRNTSRRTSSDDFTPAQRRQLYVASGGRCAVCGQQTVFGGKGMNAFIAGHNLAAVDGGQPTLDNAVPECRACSLRQLGQIGGQRSANASRRRRGLPEINYPPATRSRTPGIG